MRGASQSRNLRDVARLAGMSSTLVWCSIDLCVNAGVEAGTPGPLSPEADKQAEVADVELRCGQREPKPCVLSAYPTERRLLSRSAPHFGKCATREGCRQMFWWRLAMLTARIRWYLSVVYVIQPLHVA